MKKETKGTGKPRNLLSEQLENDGSFYPYFWFEEANNTKLRSEVVFLNEEKKLKNAGDRARNKARLSLDRVRLQLGLK
jgi:hypothetical protein